MITREARGERRAAILAGQCGSRVTEDEWRQSQHFASGVNHAGEVRGLFGSLRFVGITATNAPEDLLAELAMCAPYRTALMFPQYGFDCHESRHNLFVDSGAFSEVAFGPYRVVREITDARWFEILSLYQWVAERFRGFAYLVAPDRVGDQDVTLARLARYASAMRYFAQLGANIIVPVQKGALPMSAMFARAAEILDIDRERLIAGVPLKKDATSLEDLAELVDSLPARCRLHLLGLGPESPRFRDVITVITSRRPDAVITSDSVTVRRLVGRTNGPGGGPRTLTLYQDKAREECGDGATGVKAIALAWQGRDEMTMETRTDIRTGYYVVDKPATAQLGLFETCFQEAS